MRPGKDFTRHRIGSFSDTILTIMTMESHSLNRELFEYYNPLNRIPLTKSAFSQNRGKLNSAALPHLLRSFNSKNPFHKRYKSLHLIACDGTDSNRPADKEDTASFIPYNSNDGGYFQFHTVVMFDLLERRYTDAIVQPRQNMQEADACCTMVDRNPLPGPCLFICDRGFFSYNLLAHVVESGNFFLIRIKDVEHYLSPFKHCSLPVESEGETVCDFVLTRRRSKSVKQHPDKFKFIHPLRKFDYIPRKDLNATFPLSFRLVKLLLPNDTVEYVVTNLPQVDFPVDEIRVLYQMRWGIEVSFRFLKYNLAMNYFHSIKREFLKQEIFAKLVLYNFISLLLSCAQPPKNNSRFVCKISVSDAIYKCRSFLLGLISQSKLLALLKRDFSPVRPGRSFMRKLRSHCLMPLQNRT